MPIDLHENTLGVIWKGRGTVTGEQMEHANARLAQRAGDLRYHIIDMSAVDDLQVDSREIVTLAFRNTSAGFPSDFRTCVVTENTEWLAWLGEYVGFVKSLHAESEDWQVHVCPTLREALDWVGEPAVEGGD